MVEMRKTLACDRGISCGNFTCKSLLRNSAIYAEILRRVMVLNAKKEPPTGSHQLLPGLYKVDYGGRESESSDCRGVRVSRKVEDVFLALALVFCDRLKNAFCIRFVLHHSKLQLTIASEVVNELPQILIGEHGSHGSRDGPEQIGPDPGIERSPALFVEDCLTRAEHTSVSR